MNVIFMVVEGDGAKEGDDSVNQLKTYPAEKKQLLMYLEFVVLLLKMKMWCSHQFTMWILKIIRMLLHILMM